MILRNMQKNERRERLVQIWIERNVLGWNEPGLGNKNEFSLEWTKFKGSRKIQVEVPVGILIYGSGIKKIEDGWRWDSGVLSSWEIIEVNEMGIDKIIQGKHIGKNRDNTCSCTCAHVHTHRMTKEEKSELFLIMAPFYISFLRRRRAGKIVLQKLRNKSISRRKFQNRVTK